MFRIIETIHHPETHRTPGAPIERSGSESMSKMKRTLIAGSVFLALMVGGTPAADAATSNGDTLVQANRVCWWRC